MHTNRLDIRLLDYNPKFQPKVWAGALIDAGCYPYAANFSWPEFLQIGGIIGYPCNGMTTDQDLVCTLKEELDFIGYTSIEEIDLDYKTNPGELKIYLARTNVLGTYHMFRQDSNGLWSHKFNGHLPTERDYEKKLLRKPKDLANFPYHGWCFKLKRGLL